MNSNDTRTTHGDMSAMETQRRPAMIAGLRELADWLEAHPDVPVANTGIEAHAYTYRLDDEAGDKAIGRIAAAMDRCVVEVTDHHIEARRLFSGGVRYYAMHIRRERVAEYAALNSYTGSVQPEAVTS